MSEGLKIHLLNHSKELDSKVSYCKTKKGTLFSLNIEECTCLTCKKVFLLPIKDVRESGMTEINAIRIYRHYFDKGQYRKLQHSRLERKLWRYTQGVILNYYQLGYDNSKISQLKVNIENYYIKNYKEIPSWQDMLNQISHRMFSFM